MYVGIFFKMEDLKIQNPILKHVNSKSLFWDLDVFYYFKLVFDSRYISGFKIFRGIFWMYTLPENIFFKWFKNEKKAVSLSKIFKNGHS